MKRNWRRIAWTAGLIALVGVVGVSSVALAQSDDDSGWAFDLRSKVHEAIADVLGITLEQYDAAVDTAQTQVIDEAIAEGWQTEEQAQRMRERLEQDGPWAGPDFGRGGGMRPGMGQPGFAEIEHDSFLSVAAELLGLNEADLQNELQDGTTIAALAAEKGVDAQAIVDEYVARYAAALDEAVEAGELTQEQADRVLELATQRATDQLEGEFGGRMMDEAGRGGRPGGMRGDAPGGMPGRMPGGMRGGAQGWDSDETSSTAESGGL